MPKIRDHHLHLPHFTFDESKDLKLLYGIRVLRDLSNKMAMFFLPIFLFEVGSSLGILSSFSSFQKGMFVIGWYYMLYGLIGVVLAIPVGKLMGKIGYQRSFVISFLVKTITFMSLFLAKANPNVLILAVFFDAIDAQFFWSSYYALLSRHTHKRNMGQDLSLLQFFLQLVAVLSPAVSGVVAYFIGLEYLFLVGVVFSLSSVILALSMNSVVYHNQVSLRNFITWMKGKAFQQLSVAYISRYISDSIIYLWPLYMFFLFGSVDKVGYIYTFSLFLAMFFTFLTGRYIDKHRTKKPFYLSGGFLSLLWIARTQVFTVWGVALVDTLDRLVTNVYSLFFDTMFMKRGKGSKADEYFVYTEMILSIGRILFWGSFALFFVFFSSWNSLFIFAGIAVLVSMLISDKR